MSGPARLAARADFLAAAAWGAAQVAPLAADASFRRYHRVRRGSETAVLMDAPPDKEKPAAFVAVAERLLALGFSAPRILAADLDRGFLLLEDLGDRTFSVALADSVARQEAEKEAEENVEGAGEVEAGLYILATDALITLHERWRPAMAGDLAPYDAARLLDEAALLLDWTFPALLGAPPPPAVRAAYLAAWRELLPLAIGAPGRPLLPDTLVLRDYHVDNLMVLSGRSGVAACGLLDFQDALIGSPAYDLVSLLKDARRDVPPALADAMLARYLAARPAIAGDRFRTAFRLLGAQRACKVIGIFTRLYRRDGKPGYLRHLPRLWRLLAEDLADPGLAPLASWFARHLPPDARRSPQEESAP